MIAALKRFWAALLAGIKAIKKPMQDSAVQGFGDIQNINYLAIFVGKINNLTNTEATFSVDTDSAIAEPLALLAKNLQENRYKIAEQMLAHGDCFVFPAIDRAGKPYNSILGREQVVIINAEAGKVYEAYAILDIAEANQRRILLVRHHLLHDGNLSIVYRVLDESAKPATHEAFDAVDGRGATYNNANHIGFGWYRSPASDRVSGGLYGVPLNYGCGQIEADIKETWEQIANEFRRGEIKIFADHSVIMKKTAGISSGDNRDGYHIPEGIFPIDKRSGDTGSLIDSFAPTLRYSEHYSKLVGQYELYERQIGTSKGILTSNETTVAATATEVKRSNSDTLALLERVRSSIDMGNTETLKAHGVFLNIPEILWAYSADWYDPFEDPEAQFKRLLEAKNAGETAPGRILAWLFPKMTEEELAAELEAARTSTASTDLGAMEAALRQ